MLEEFSKTEQLKKSISVLFVEDDIFFREETSITLGYLFKTVDVAANGENGLKMYNSYFQKHLKYYDIIITDVNMPKMDGIELVQSVYKVNSLQSIIVISAYSETDTLIKLINMGVEQFLSKPLDYYETIKVLQEN